MGLAPPVTLDGIKARYKELAKKYHPDLNAACRQSEELLKSINMAYTILKMAYGKFEKLS
jgi:DnaJ-class molecular chaperone